MQAFNNCKLSAWALFCDKRLLHKHASKDFSESEQLLLQLLKSMEKSNTVATYTLCLYEDITDRKKIKASTEADFSYNVTLFDQDEYPSTGMVTRRETYSRLEDRFDVLEAKLATYLDQQNDDDQDEEEAVGAKPSGLLAMIDRLLDNPNIQEKLGDKIIGFIEGFAQNMNTMGQKTVGAIGNTGQAAPGPIQQITQEQYDKINSSVAILASIDAQLGDHLEAIAKLAQEKPAKYKSLIMMLNTFL